MENKRKNFKKMGLKEEEIRKKIRNANIWQRKKNIELRVTLILNNK